MKMAHPRTYGTNAIIKVVEGKDAKKTFTPGVGGGGGGGCERETD